MPFSHFHFRALLAHVTPHRNILILAVLLMLGESVIALANPWIAGLFTQHMLEPTETMDLGLTSLLALWALLLVTQSGLSVSNQYLLGQTGETMLANLRMRLYDHLQSLPLGYFHDKRRGEVLALLGNDALQISHFITATAVSLLPLLITFFGAFIILFWISPLIATLAGALVPVFFLAMKLIGRRLRPLSSEWVRTHAEMFATLEENIGMLPAIKSFTREAHESARFQDCNIKLMQVAKRQLFIGSILGPATHLLAGLGLLLLLWVSTLQVQNGALAPSDMVSILLYSMLLTRPVSGLAGVYGSVQTARGAAERLIEAFAAQPEPDDAGAPPLKTVAGCICLKNIHFAYPSRPKVLNNMTLEIQAGETVALTGANGSGKSTVVHLLMRFADPDQGQILLDDVDIRGVSISSLRRQIGLVAQHVLLLNGSVRDNIGYGRLDADLDEIMIAARNAMAHDFITQLPQGYETVIGDQGIRLSGGQRQRIALARALLKNPPILIFDEATAMFDPEGELAFIRECQPILASRTVILITHRPASLALADRVVSLS
ncbi:MAG: ABC transporter ATP-binding protein [Candidatus Competibacteraceae bacterium]|jgi:ABC-type multidrug transport system fused ATPase/permease subunit|nr:ABC transporter ATP-binding protein [Candidatus Competibacteraceae bacterium]